MSNYYLKNHCYLYRGKVVICTYTNNTLSFKDSDIGMSIFTIETCDYLGHKDDIEVLRVLYE